MSSNVDSDRDYDPGEFLTSDSDSEIHGHEIFKDFGYGLEHGLGQSHDFGNDFGHGHIQKPRTSSDNLLERFIENRVNQAYQNHFSKLEIGFRLGVTL